MKQMIEYIIRSSNIEIEEDWKRNVATGALALGLLTGTPNADASTIKKAPVKTEMTIPSNLWKGLVAEDTQGDSATYLAIASTVRNRLAHGKNMGLVALKRKNLDDFIQKNASYMLKVKKVDIIKLAKQAISDVFDSNKDFANGATHYEHTGVYPTPSWAKSMNIVKVLYKGTKKEITFYKEK